MTLIRYSIFLPKLLSFEFLNPFSERTTSFLTERTAIVVVGGLTSPSCLVNSGVQQGSGFSPVLFLLFNSDFLFEFSKAITYYADELVLHSSSNFNAEPSAAPEKSCIQEINSWVLDLNFFFFFTGK